MVGGLDMQAQARELARRPHVVIATPGRLRALLELDAELARGFARTRFLVSACVCVGKGARVCVVVCVGGGGAAGPDRGLSANEAGCPRPGAVHACRQGVPVCQFQKPRPCPQLCSAWLPYPSRQRLLCSTCRLGLTA